ncbi:MAG: ABC transporter ATP-binding protein [Deltaproteobacteria bacterium]|nr:ABC transporter ATP-binding protein [Candidatus Zymogenaceae bacterium]
MEYLEIRRVSKRFGDVAAVSSADLAAAKGSITVILGPSGCGKSTLLRIIAGIEAPDEGAIYLAGRDITGAGPTQRNIAMVFQDYALYPHMNAEKNMTFGLIMRGVGRREAKERAARAAVLLGIEGLLDKKPGALSGGERQRLAVGRAIVKEPSLFLMDEPLSNVDAQFKAAMRIEITRLIRDLEGTMIWVTHDQVEAMAMADTLAIMKSGTIEAVGAPRGLYEHPPNLFVAGFLGNPPMNIIPAGSAAYRRLMEDGPAGTDASAIVGVRPEDILIGRGKFTATVLFREDLGFETRLTLAIADGPRHETLTARVVGTPPDVGGTVRFSIDRRRLHLFDTITERRLE